MIHPTAIIHPQAQVDPSVNVEAYAIIDAHVVIGPRCQVGPQVHLTGHTTIGADNWFHTGAVIGDAPQDLKYHGEPTRLRIGDSNIFREHVTVHRSNSLLEDTVIGSHCFLMALSHVGHNVRLGNHVIVANNALLGGHVVVDDRAFISANCMVHQFVRVGMLAMMQAGTAISLDLPPFLTAHGVNMICGLNTVGLRRAGYSPEVRLELKRLYHALFRSTGTRLKRVADARPLYTSAPAQQLLDFVAATKRGLCADTKRARFEITARTHTGATPSDDKTEG